MPINETVANRDDRSPRILRKVGIGFTGGPYRVQETVEFVRMAERAGFDSAWACDDIGGRDPFIPLAGWAQRTSQIRLGVTDTNPYTRHPVGIAATMATLDEACEGRAVLGLSIGGSWRSLIADQWSEPVEFIEETVRVLRALWEESETQYQDIPVSLRDSLWVWPDAPSASFRKRIDIYLLGGNPEMTRLAARVADGLLLPMGMFKTDLRAQIQLFQSEALRAGRDPEGLEIAPMVMISVVEAERELDVMRRIVAFETHRLSEEVAREQSFEMKPFQKIKEIYACDAEQSGIVKYGTEPAAWEAAALITRKMLEAFAIVGSPSQCIHQLEEIMSAGATFPILLPLGCDVPAAIEVGRIFATSGEMV